MSDKANKERLSNLEEVDWYLLQQLIESIQMQESGPREAVETVRKKLKHGAPQQKLRVLEVNSFPVCISAYHFFRCLNCSWKIVASNSIVSDKILFISYEAYQI